MGAKTASDAIESGLLYALWTSHHVTDEMGMTPEKKRILNAYRL